MFLKKKKRKSNTDHTVIAIGCSIDKFNDNEFTEDFFYLQSIIYKRESSPTDQIR